MSKQLAALLRTTSMGLPELAKAVRKGGRKGDTILAHINPREAALLKAHGGSGAINPNTGLPEFDDYAPVDTSADNIDVGGGYNPATGTGDVATAQAAASSPPMEVNNVPSTYSSAPSAAGATAAPETFAPQSLGAAASPTAPTAFNTPSAPSATSFSPRLASGDNIDMGGGFNPATGTGDFATGQAASAPVLPTTTNPVSPEQSLSSQFGDKTAALAKALGTNGLGLLKLGIGGTGAIQGALAAKTAQQQAGATQAQLSAMGQPFINQGNELVQLGQAGGMTAPQQQAIQAMRAQTQQALQNSGQAGGGTAAQQAEANVQRAAQVFAQNNIDEGMKMINIGNSYVQNAIKTGYQQSVDAQAASSNFYRNLMSSIPTADPTAQAHSIPTADPTAQAQVAGTQK